MNSTFNVADFPQPARRVRCIFCDVILTKSPKGTHRSSDKAMEHILKKSFIKELGHDSSMVLLSLRTGSTHLQNRGMPTNKFLAGEVCRGCNNGWMDELDISISHIVMAAAKCPSLKISFTPTEALLLSRWLLKMACVLESTEKPHRRHIPRQIRLLVKNDGYLPANFISFYSKLDDPIHDIGPAMIDIWYSSTKFQDNMQHKRLKFGVQYNQALFGCAYIQEPDIYFTGISDIHEKIYESSSAPLVLTEWPTGFNIFTDPVPPSMPDYPLNRLLLSVGVEKFQIYRSTNQSI